MGGSKKDPTTSVKHLEASLYFLQWTRSSFQAYTRTINELFLKKLVEHCTQCKVEEESERNEIKKLSKGPKVGDKSEHHLIKERLKEAAVRMTQWEGEKVHQGNKICLAEIAVMQRLTQLVKISGTILDIIERLHKWNNKNLKLLRRHAISLDLKEHIISMFDGTRCIGEIFHLTSVNLDQCKEAYRGYLTKEEYSSKDNKVLVIGEPKKYIPLLETKINHYRTIVHHLATALIYILQTILRYIPQEQIDIRVRELKDAIDQIPPMYLKVEETKLSKMAEKILAQPPSNKRSYPLAPMKDDTSVSRSGRSARSGRKKSHSSRRFSRRSNRFTCQQKSNVTKSKYKNPLSASTHS